MKYNTEFSYIYNLLKSAAKDVPDFYPDWVRGYRQLDRYESLSDIKKEIPVEDYREETANIYDEEDLPAIVKAAVGSFTEQCLRQLTTFDMQNNQLMQEALANGEENKVQMYKAFRFVSAKLIRFLVSLDALNYFSSKIMNGENLSSAMSLEEEIVSAPFTVETPVGKQSKTIKIQKDVNLVSVLRAFLIDYKRAVKDEYQETPCIEKLLDVSKLAEYSKLNYLTSSYLRKDRSSFPKMDIVFSKQPSDLLSMSIRGDWTSCQYLLREKDKYNYKAIQSTISPYCGIIYLTSSKDYGGRGEEMIARSLVLLLETDDGREPILHVSKVYSSYFDKQKIKNLFVNSLQNHSPLKVDDGALAYSGEYSFPAYETEHSPSGMVPYLDPQPHKELYNEFNYLPVKREREERFSKEARKFNAYLENFCERYDGMLKVEPSKENRTLDLGIGSCVQFLESLHRFDQGLIIVDVVNGQRSSLQEFAHKLSQIIDDVENSSSDYEANNGFIKFYDTLLRNKAAQL